jgi:SAM-dependent methyltransferase
MIGGFLLSQAICVAARLGVADRLRDGPRTAAELAEATGAQAASLHRLLRSLAGFGLFAEDEAGRFRLTELAELLCRDVPGSLRAEAVSIGELSYPASVALLDGVRTGRPGFDAVFGRPLFDYLAADLAAARIFDEGLAGLREQITAAVLGGYDFSNVGKLVDVGGGPGDMMAALLSKYPGMRGVLFDRPEVIERARARFHATGDRCALVGGDFFSSVPAGGDVYLLRHVVHDWDDDRAARVLSNCRRVMKRSGRLLLIESVIRPGNAPSLGKALDLVMLTLTGGRERTEPEYRGLLAEAGFRLTRVVPTSAGIDLIESVPSQEGSR